MKKLILFIGLLSLAACLKDEPLIPIGATNDQAPALDNFIIENDNLTASITEDGIGGVQQHGFVYSTTNTTPTLDDAVIDLGSLPATDQPQPFTTAPTVFQAVTTYYVRAFVRNKHYTVYSENVETFFTNDPFQFQMITIPSGTFSMGTNDWSYSQPIHTVTLSSFKMSKYEVTQKQWRDVMGTSPSFNGCDNCPVENVSWNDIQTFLQTLNAATGKTYRLPSEAEWEYAARGGQNYLYAGSDDINAVAWYYDNSYALGLSHPNYGTNPVGQKAANGYGLYDMSGNVWEWCQDVWHDNYNGAPTNGSAWTSGDSSNRVIRGGSWGYGADGCRSASRYNSDAVNRYFYIGFRVCLS